MEIIIAAAGITLLGIGFALILKEHPKKDDSASADKAKPSFPIYSAPKTT